MHVFLLKLQETVSKPTTLKKRKRSFLQASLEKIKHIFSTVLHANISTSIRKIKQKISIRFTTSEICYGVVVVFFFRGGGGGGGSGIIKREEKMVITQIKTQRGGKLPLLSAEHESPLSSCNKIE